jgi:hypothetical protein
VIDDLGGNTEDLLALHRVLPAETTTHPGDREHRVRRFGRVNYVTGVTLGVAFMMFSLALALVTDHGAFTDPTARLFATLSFVAIMLVATALVLLGGLERLNRPQRSATRQVLAQLAVMREQLDVVLGPALVVPGLLAAIEKRLDEMTATIAAVPDYGRGVVDGMQIRNEALGPEVP